MKNKNCENIENCTSCYSCDYCNSCYSCTSCYSCDYCNSCYSCDYCNSCYYCFGLRMSEKMIFCIGEGGIFSKGSGFQKTLQIFNKDVSQEEYQKAVTALHVKNFTLPIATWVDIKDIQSPTSTQKQLGGYLKVLPYKEAWAEMWSKLSSEDKKFFTTFKNFDAEIFKKITGIDVSKEVSLSGKEVSVTLDGVTYTAVIK